MRIPRLHLALSVSLATLATLILGATPAPVGNSALAAAGGLPEGFRDELLFDGLVHPVSVQFAADGRVFVAEQRGRVVVYDGPGDASPSVFANLETNVFGYWDRGLLGLALAPSFPTDPSVYVMYTYNKSPNGGPVPRWAGSTPGSDLCPTPPGGTIDGCPTLGRLSRLTASGNVAVGGETVLIEDWCNQFPSHTVGHLAFGPEGALYASAGEGANFYAVDYGQHGGTLPNTTSPVVPRNPCGDPGPADGSMSAPTAEGGALRSQDIRTRGGGDPVGLDGAIIRIDPGTGAAWAANANHADPDPNAARIVAYGLRNPFRFALHPETGAVWLGDVGWGTWEEINELPDADAAPRNFGWPCREGAGENAQYKAAGLALCQSLATADTSGPFFAYQHGQSVVAGDGCASGGASISGMAFLPISSGYPAAYRRGLFFTDYSRGCMWWMPPTVTGRPNPAAVQRFADLRPIAGETGGATFLTVAPDGDVVYADFDRGEIRRIHYYGPNVPPTAAFSATPTSGTAPLTVAFDASDSSDPNDEPLVYEWDLDGDGAFDDGVGQTISRTYGVGNVTVGLRVRDGLGVTDTATQLIAAGNTAPSLSWSTPAVGTRWAVGETIGFAATAADAQDGTLPATAFTWTLAILHCPDGCHSHPINSWTGVRSGSFVAPAHEYPSSLRLSLRVADSKGLATTVVRDYEPRTVVTSARSEPFGVPLTLGDVAGQTTPTVTTIAGSKVSVAAPEYATIGETTYRFSSWSDGGARVHEATAGTALTARYGVFSTTDAANTCAASGVVGVGSTWRSTVLGSSTDVDWYRFTLGTSARVQVVLGDVAVPSRLELFRGCTTSVAVSDRGGTGMEEIVTTLPAGTHAVRISGTGSATAPSQVLRIRTIGSGVTVLSSRAITSGSTLRLVGEVYNNSTSWRGPVKVTARLYNASNVLLASWQSTADLQQLAPLGRSPFRISGARPAGFARATFTISAATTLLRPTVPTITAWSGTTDAQGRYKVTGSMRNGAAATTVARVAVTLYGERAEVLDGGLATVATTTLAAGETTTFSLVFATPGLAPERVAIRATTR